MRALQKKTFPESGLSSSKVFSYERPKRFGLVSQRNCDGFCQNNPNRLFEHSTMGFNLWSVIHEVHWSNIDLISCRLLNSITFIISCRENVWRRWDISWRALGKWLEYLSYHVIKYKRSWCISTPCRWCLSSTVVHGNNVLKLIFTLGNLTWT